MFPPQAQPSTLVYYTITNGGDTLTITVLGSASVVTTRVPDADYDGVYDGWVVPNPTTIVPIRAALICNTFISYNIPDFPQPVAGFMGTIMTDSGSCEITYAYADPSTNIPANTVVSASFSVSGTPPSTSIVINSTTESLPFTSYLQNKHPASPLDGIWVSLDPSAYVIIEMSYGVYRFYSFFASSASFLGTWEANATHIEIAYAYVQPSNSIAGSRILYTYELSNEGDILTIADTVPSNPPAPPLVLHRAE